MKGESEVELNFTSFIAMETIQLQAEKSRNRGIIILSRIIALIPWVRVLAKMEA